MTITNQNLVRIESRQTYLGLPVLNVYNFFLPLNLSSVSLSELIDQFDLAYTQQIAQAQVDSTIHTVIYAKMLNNGVLEAAKTVSQPGLRSGLNPAPSYVSASYRLQRTVTDIRNGRKSIVGVADEDTAGNTFSGPALLIWQALESVLDTNLTTSDGIWEPVILGKEDPLTPGSYNISSIQSVFLRTNVGSQVSRKDL